MRDCEIRVCTTARRYYLGFGVTRSRQDYKTFAGAKRAAEKKGYRVTTQVDPMVEFLKADKRTKIVTNLLSGKLVRIPENTPDYCDPSREAYWTR